MQALPLEAVEIHLAYIQDWDIWSICMVQAHMHIWNIDKGNTHVH